MWSADRRSMLEGPCGLTGRLCRTSSWRQQQKVYWHRKLTWTLYYTKTKMIPGLIIVGPLTQYYANLEPLQCYDILYIIIMCYSYTVAEHYKISYYIYTYFFRAAGLHQAQRVHRHWMAPQTHARRFLVARVRLRVFGRGRPLPAAQRLCM